VPDERAPAAESALLSDESANAARVLAHVLVLEAGSIVGHVALEREDRAHDISPALVEIAVDPHQYSVRRVRALEWLAPHGDVGVIDAVEPLTRSDEEWIRTPAITAFQALSRRKAEGFLPRTRRLPPKPAT
jgi:hypothetical protein